VRSGYNRVGQHGNEAARGILKVVLFVERERREDGMVQSLDGRLCRLLLTEGSVGGTDAEGDDCKQRAETAQHAFRLGHFLFPGLWRTARTMGPGQARPRDAEGPFRMTDPPRPTT